VNNDLGKTDHSGSISLHSYAKQRLHIREPVYDAVFYNDMMKCFLDNRPEIDSQLLAQLKANPSHGYDYDEIEEYHLNSLDLVPGTAIHQEGSETWIELQPLQKPGYRKH